MAVEAPASKVARQNDYIVVIFFILVGLYFAYDGWINAKYQRQNIAWPFNIEEIADASNVIENLKKPQNAAQSHLQSKLSLEAQVLLTATLSDDALKNKLVDELNRLIIHKGDLYNAQAFKDIAISPETQEFIEIAEPKEKEIYIRNKLLIADIFPQAVSLDSWKTGQPSANLKFNRIYGPIICFVVAIYFFMSVLQQKNRKVAADDTAVTVDGKLTIPYQTMTKIDRRFFKKEGYFTIEYRQNDADKKVKLSSRKYDALSCVLDEIIKHTGAASATSDETA